MRNIVLLHGFAGSPALWEPTLRALPPGYRSQCPALPGHCGMAFPAGGRWREVVDAFAPAVHALGGACVWGGYSLGARIAMAALAHRPEWVKALVLVGGHPGLQSASERAERAAWEDDWSARLAREDMTAFVAAWQAQPLFASQRSLPADAAAQQRAWRLGHEPVPLRAAFDALRLSDMPDRRPLLAAASVPIWLVTGAADPKYGALARELAALGPHVQHRVTQGAGHNVPWEAPAEMARVLHEVLSR